MSTALGVTADPKLSELIVAIGERKDREAFATLFNHFAPRVKSYLMRLGAGREAAEELAQETLFTVWRRAEAYDPGRSAASTWIFTIARNLRIDLARRNRRPVLTKDPFEPSDGPLSPKSALGALQNTAKITAAVALLSPEQSQVIRLAFLSDKPHTEIAKVLGIPLGTVSHGFASRWPGCAACWRRGHDSTLSSVGRAPTGTRNRDPGLRSAPGHRGPPARLRCLFGRGSIDRGRRRGLLENLPLTTLRADALAQALARLERPQIDTPAGMIVQQPEWISVAPVVLDAARRRRRWAAPGVWVAPVTGVAGGARTYLLRVGPGMSIPRHTHRGSELICVLKGGYADGGAVHGPGDFAESDDSVEHTPVITTDGECVCLVFADGRLVPRDWVGRLFQPIVRI